MMNRVNQLYQRRHQMLWLHHMMSVEQAEHAQDGNSPGGTAGNAAWHNRPVTAAEILDCQENTR
jgi:hypothetical protein